MKGLSIDPDALRAQILSQPDLILEDRAIMRALVTAEETSLGGNVVDLRGVAMERLESRLDRLETTHRTIVATAYDNLSGTNQIHRAVLALLDAAEFEAFLSALDGSVRDILRVDCVRMVLESAANAEALLPEGGRVLRIVRPGYVGHYLAGGRTAAPPRNVVLRALPEGFGALYEGPDLDIRSEAALRLDLGDQRLPAMLLFGAADPRQFSPDQGTDLLEFFAGVVERLMRRWLS